MFFWKEMEKQVRQFIKECDVCKRFKYDTLAYPGILQPLPIPATAWIDVSLDFIDGLPMSKGYSVILVVVDRLKKYVYLWE